MSGEHLLLPEAKRYYDTLRGLPRTGSLPLPEWRRGRIGLTPQLTLPKNVGVVEDASVLKEDFAPIALRIYRPKGTGPFPLLVYFHGGGFVGGGLQSHAQIAANYCGFIQAVVVAVNYRLAPEHPFPAAVDDAWAAVQWAAQHAGELQADIGRLVVAGESAGGNLALVMGLLAKQHKQLDLIKALISVCPLLDAADLTRHSYDDFWDDAFEDKAAIEWFLEQYHPQRERQNPLLSPIYAPDLTELPPTFILTAEVDVLRDEAEEYARKLEQAGVRVRCKRYKGHFHNSMIKTDVFGKIAEDTYREIAAFVQSST